MSGWAPIRLGSVHAQHPGLRERLGEPIALGLVQGLADSGHMALEKILKVLSDLTYTLGFRARLVCHHAFLYITASAWLKRTGPMHGLGSDRKGLEVVK